VRWDELTREQLSALLPEALVVVPTGATEQHGPHLATCADALIAQTVVERAVAQADASIIIAPTVSYGASDHHLP